MQIKPQIKINEYISNSSKLDSREMSSTDLALIKLDETLDGVCSRFDETTDNILSKIEKKVNLISRHVKEVANRASDAFHGFLSKELSFYLTKEVINIEKTWTFASDKGIAPRIKEAENHLIKFHDALNVAQERYTKKINDSHLSTTETMIKAKISFQRNINHVRLQMTENSRLLWFLTPLNEKKIKEVFAKGVEELNNECARFDESVNQAHVEFKDSLVEISHPVWDIENLNELSQSDVDLAFIRMNETFNGVISRFNETKDQILIKIEMMVNLISHEVNEAANRMSDAFHGLLSKELSNLLSKEVINIEETWRFDSDKNIAPRNKEAENHLIKFHDALNAAQERFTKKINNSRSSTNKTIMKAKIRFLRSIDHMRLQMTSDVYQVCLWFLAPRNQRQIKEGFDEDVEELNHEYARFDESVNQAHDEYMESLLEISHLVWETVNPVSLSAATSSSKASSVSHQQKRKAEEQSRGLLNEQENNSTISERNKKQAEPQDVIKCPVCFDSVREMEKENRKLVTPNCGHAFCDRCIQRQEYCPMCGQQLTRPFRFVYLY